MTSIFPGLSWLAVETRSLERCWPCCLDDLWCLGTSAEHSVFRARQKECFSPLQRAFRTVEAWWHFCRNRFSADKSFWRKFNKFRFSRIQDLEYDLVFLRRHYQLNEQTEQPARKLCCAKAQWGVRRQDNKAFGNLLGRFPKGSHYIPGMKQIQPIQSVQALNSAPQVLELPCDCWVRQVSSKRILDRRRSGAGHLMMGREGKEAAGPFRKEDGESSYS